MAGTSLIDLILSDPSLADRYQQVTAMMPPSSPAAATGVTGTVDSSYVGGTGDYNATHEGPGTQGLTFGEESQYTDLARSLFELVQQRFPGVDMGGILNARNIKGTNTPSEHAYGAALDIMAAGALGDRVYNYLTRPRIANQYDYSNVLWEVPDHYNHLHVGWLY